MQQKPVRVALVAFLFLTMVLATSCSTFFSVRMTSPKVWLEGKDYIVQFSMANQEKAQKITLYYRVNDQAVQVVEPVLKGAIREYSITASELAPGRLDYYVIVMDEKGQEHKEGLVTVSIISMAEGKARAEQDLSRRVQVIGPREIEVNADLDISLRVLRPQSGTEVSIFLKDASSTRYRTVTLTPQAGDYRFRIASRDLKEGVLNYYFTLSEQHPDFGKIGISYPGDAEARPLAVKVIGLRELAERMEKELSGSVVHQPVGEVLATRDLPVSFSLTIPKNSLLEKLILDEPQALIFYGRKDSRTRFLSVPMSRDRPGVFTAVIDRRSLAAGVNCYYFTITALTRDVGSIESTYPAEGGGAPFVYRIISLEEMKARREQEYARRVSHTPPAMATLTAPLGLSLAIQDAPVSRRGVLHFKKSSQRTYRDIAMTTSAEGLAGAVPVEDLEEGMMTYYFTVNLIFPDVGEVRFDYPQRGASGPLTLAVESSRETIRRLEQDLAGRIRHTLITEASEEKDIEIGCTVQEMKPGTEVKLYLKRDRDARFLVKKMGSGRGGFAAELSRADMKAGYTAYYIEVTAPHARVRSISVTIPADGQNKPQVIAVGRLEPKPEPKPTVTDSIVFDHIKEPVPGKPLAIRLQIKQPVAGMKVELAYRVSGESRPYRTVAMSARGVNYSGTMEAVVLNPGVTIEYYFIIRLPDAEKELTYPAADKLPLSFTVSDKTDDKDKPGVRGKK